MANSGKAIPSPPPDIASLLAPLLPSLVAQAAGAADPDVAAKLLTLADRVASRVELSPEDQRRQAVASSLVAQAQALSLEAIEERAMSVLEIGLGQRPDRLEAWVRRLRLAAGQARPAPQARATAGGRG